MQIVIKDFIIAIYMLYVLGKEYYSKNIGLYRDVGLAVFKNVSGQLQKKNLQFLFKQKGLQIIVECSLKVLNYPDLPFNPNLGGLFRGSF